MKTCFRYCLLIALGLIAEVHADERWYLAELPLEDVPDSYECNIQVCYVHGLQLHTYFRVTNGHQYRREQIQTFREFTCANGYCYDRDGYEVGISEHLGRRFGHVPFGYYIVSHAPEHNVHYRLGTGPYADRYPSLYIYGHEPATDSQQAAWGDNEPSCSPQSDYCYFDYQGQEVEALRKDLVDYFPMAQVNEEMGEHHWCSMESCYTNDVQFIGLNPFYHEYQ
jgi:hypothetical protein